MNNITQQQTLAHELISNDEQKIGLFFISIAIQVLPQKSALNQIENEPIYIKFFFDAEINLPQRVLVKNILQNKKFKPVVETIKKILFDYGKKDFNLPHETFLSSIKNKTFLIRQIFGHTNQILDEFKFIPNCIFRNKDTIDYENLFTYIKDKTIEYQILILGRVFCYLQDENKINKNKAIKTSFKENLMFVENEHINAVRVLSPVELANLKMLYKFCNT